MSREGGRENSAFLIGKGVLGKKEKRLLQGKKQKSDNLGGGGTGGKKNGLKIWQNFRCFSAAGPGEIELHRKKALPQEKEGWLSN